ncbi:hypothetical protein ACR6C2_38220 [Streptomyces sp. INA 01156]
MAPVDGTVGGGEVTGAADVGDDEPDATMWLAPCGIVRLCRWHLSVVTEPGPTGSIPMRSFDLLAGIRWKRGTVQQDDHTGTMQARFSRARGVTYE